MQRYTFFLISCSCLFQAKRNSLSFSSARDVRARIEVLPAVPRWNHLTLQLPTAYKTKSPATLYWRDPLEVAQDLYRNPIFSGCLEKNPYRLHPRSHPNDRVYGEFMSGDFAWEYQVCSIYFPRVNLIITS